MPLGHGGAAEYLEDLPQQLLHVGDDAVLVDVELPVELAQRHVSPGQLDAVQNAAPKRDRQDTPRIDFVMYSMCVDIQ